MSGHSKWATTKHKKAVVDQRRGKLFAKLIRAIEVASREGGPDPGANATLADAIARGRDANCPADTIDRAVKRGTGELEGVRYEAVTYEGFAPGGVAVLIEATTDNRNRTGPEIRRMFARAGGNLAEPGAVSWMFNKRGLVIVPAEGVDEETMLTRAAEAGADDVSGSDEYWEIICDPTHVAAVRERLSAAGLEVESASSAMIASTNVAIEALAAGSVLRLLEDLDEHDDVQEVWSNIEVVAGSPSSS